MNQDGHSGETAAAAIPATGTLERARRAVKQYAN